METSATTFVASTLFRTDSTRVRLHQRHVLVRRRVEDHLRPVALEDLAHLDAVADVGEQREGGREVALVDQLALDLEQRALGDVHEDQRGGRPGARSGGRAPSRSSRPRR